MSGFAGSFALKAFGQPLDYPYLLGAYMAVSAVEDLAVLIDGPDCAVLKAEHLCPSHDLRSGLLDDGRVDYSASDVRTVVGPRERALRRRLRALASRADLSALLVGGLPMCSLTGTQYDRVAREASRELGKPVLELAARSLEGGWMLGYGSALAALARGLPLPRGRPRPGRAAVIGHLMDRLEEDRRADARELRRLLEALGLETASVWLDGGGCRELGRAAQAELLVSLPYGREAGRALAARTGARLVEADLPFGLGGTCSFLRQVGAAAGRSEEAERFAQSELARLLPRLEGRLGGFLHRRFFAAADPFLIGPLCGLLEELGGVVAGAASAGLAAESGPARPGLLERPTSGRLAEALAAARAEGLDLVIGSSDVLRAAGPGSAGMEFGYPSRLHHALSPEPHLGFEGCLSFLGRAANELARFDRLGGRA